MGGNRFTGTSFGQFNTTLYNPNEFVVISRNRNYKNTTAYIYRSLLNTVLDTDYFTYALVYTCLWEPSLSNASDWVASNYAWMYTREPVVDQSLINSMAETTFYAQNINPESKVTILGVRPNLKTPQSGCQH